jgi:ABC-type branched-subunit amino acid transport system permease subunit
MTLHGGARTFLGPFVGAGTYLVLGDWLAVFTERLAAYIRVLRLPLGRPGSEFTHPLRAVNRARTPRMTRH